MSTSDPQSPDKTEEVDDTYIIDESNFMRHLPAISVSPEFMEPSPEICPERGLMAAVLWRACWYLFSNVESQDRVSAVKWFQGIGPSHEGFSFKDISETLELSGKYIRLINNALHEAILFGKEVYERKSKSEGEANRAFNRKLAKRPGYYISASK